MAKEPMEAVMPILQQIQATLGDHGRLLREHTGSFKRIEVRLDELQDSVVTAIGLAAHSNVRHENVQRQIEELRERVERLEEKV